jgi:outer membrane protein assembly factor BamA
LSLLLCLIGAQRTAAAAPIRAIQIFGNQKTRSTTIVRIARISVGGNYSEKVSRQAKDDLVSSGLFSWVEIDAKIQPNGVDVEIRVRERLSWFLIPSAVFWSGNKGGSLLFGHTNLRGQNERLIVYGGLFTSNFQVAAAYQDLAILNSHFYGRVDATLSSSNVNEFNPDLSNGDNLSSPELFRVSAFLDGGAGVQLGRELTRELHLDLYYHFSVLRHYRSCVTASCADGGIAESSPLSGNPAAALEPPSPDGTLAYLHFSFEYNSVVNEWGIRRGTRVGTWIELSHPLLGSEFELQKGNVHLTYGRRIFLEHNLVLNAGLGAGRQLPFSVEFEGGGPSLRGYAFRQFRGDTMFEAHAEYIAPLVKLWKMDVRGAILVDSMALWFRSLEGAFTVGGSYQVRHDDGTFRNFLPAVDASGRLLPPPSGLGRDDWHNSVGAGIRIYLRSVNLPLIGVDFGYGLEAGSTQILLSAGIPASP